MDKEKNLYICRNPKCGIEELPLYADEMLSDPRLKEAIAEIKTTEYYDDWGGESGRKEQRRILNILEKWIPGLKEN